MNLEDKRIAALKAQVAELSTGSAVASDMLDGLGQEVIQSLKQEKTALEARIAKLEPILRAMVDDEAFADLCAAIGEEPSWIKRARAVLRCGAQGDEMSAPTAICIYCGQPIAQYQGQWVHAKNGESTCRSITKATPALAATEPKPDSPETVAEKAKAARRVIMPFSLESWI
jgi:hypothetical protein